MKKALLIIAAIILLSGGIGIGYLIWGGKGPDPRIGQEREGKPAVDKQPQSEDQYKTAFNAPIAIKGEFQGNWLHIWAGDGWKHNTKDVEVICPVKVRHHSITALYGPMYNIDAREFRHSVDALYFYNFGRVGLGGGLNAIFSGSKLYDIGPKIGIKGEF